MKHRHPATLGTIHALGVLDLVDAKAPTEFRIFSYGKNTSDKGDFIFDEKAAADVMAAFAKKGARLTMDYEHQAFNASSNGQPAPNSCKAWTPTIRLDANGKPELWATNCAWTDRARAFIESGEYLHFSPAFEADPKTMRVERIVNMALTNIPALDKQQPLIAASAAGDHAIMKCKLCNKTLKAPSGDDDGDEVMCTDHPVLPKFSGIVGLKADASETVVLGAVAELHSFRGNIVQLLDVKSPAEAIGKIMALKAKDAEIVALTATLDAERGQRLQALFDGILDEAGKSGKLEPAQREVIVKPLLKMTGGKVTQDAIDMLSAAIAGLGKAKVNVQDANGGGGLTPESNPDGTQKLTPVDIEISKKTGVAPVDIIAFHKLAATGAFKGMDRPLKYIQLA